MINKFDKESKEELIKKLEDPFKEYKKLFEAYFDKIIPLDGCFSNL